MTTSCDPAFAPSYAPRKNRAEELSHHWPHAAEVLRFYLVLLDVQERASAQARAHPASLATPDAAAAFAAQHVLPRVIEASVAHGPPALQQGVLERFGSIDLEATCRAWLCGQALDRFDAYLARAATGPVLEVLGADAGEVCRGPRNERSCPRCGGIPQLAYVAASDEDLVTPHRYLECSRCASSWAFTRMTCAACGEIETSKLLVFSELGALEAELSGNVISGTDPSASPVDAKVARMPHVRIDGCATCSRYLLTIDLRREPRAVPVVDELAALPFYVYAQERGLAKIVANQLGF
jgi:Protein involved in formate dehydrogenase formation